MKTLAKFLLLVFIVFTSVFFLKDLIVKNAITIAAARLTGLTVNIKKAEAGIFSSSLKVEGLKFYNPKGYADEILALIPEIYISYDPKELLRKKVRLKTLKIYLKEFVVVKSNFGELNLSSIKGVKKEENGPAVVKKKSSKNARIQIDSCDLKIDKVLYKDYSGREKPVVQEFDIYIEEHYTNISGVNKILELILFKVLFKTSLNKLLDLNLKALGKDLGAVIENSAAGGFSAGNMTREKSKEAIKKSRKAAEEIVDNLKKALEGIKFQFNE